jgi:hypothetical protein
MASRRREADRRRKQKWPQLFLDEGYVPSHEDDRFEVIASDIRERRRIDCGCPQTDWTAAENLGPRSGFCTAAWLAITRRKRFCPGRSLPRLAEAYFSGRISIRIQDHVAAVQKTRFRGFFSPRTVARSPRLPGRTEFASANTGVFVCAAFPSKERGGRLPKTAGSPPL